MPEPEDETIDAVADEMVLSARDARGPKTRRLAAIRALARILVGEAEDVDQLRQIHEATQTRLTSEVARLFIADVNGRMEG